MIVKIEQNKIIKKKTKNRFLGRGSNGGYLPTGKALSGVKLSPLLGQEKVFQVRI